ncbi:unnamed protein product [Paramecium sonneborni]|uniref:Uncharacterized protein n=1 Tax=Paramecium sonneborni TaxID=65129 RepID=A0A8S1P8S2_9CILI|nr:unnamed protein product [Paramecium sonneborni]
MEKWYYLVSTNNQYFWFKQIAKAKFYLEKKDNIFLVAKKLSHKYIISMNKDKIQGKSSNLIGQIRSKKKYDFIFMIMGLILKKQITSSQYNRLIIIYQSINQIIRIWIPQIPNFLVNKNK